MAASGNSPTGYGTLLDLATSSGFESKMKIRDVNQNNKQRNAVDMTHTASPSNRMEFYPSKLVDEGEIQITLILPIGAEPPIDQKPETITIKYPLQDGQTTPEQKSGQGFFTNFGERMPLNDRMEMNCTIKKTGLWTHTAADGTTTTTPAP
jgi:hypothetical protein